MRDVVITDTLCAEMDFFVERDPAVLQKSHREGDREGNNNGDNIKSHLTFKRMDVLEEDAVSEVQDQEYYNWQKGCRVRLLMHYVNLSLYIVWLFRMSRHQGIHTGKSTFLSGGLIRGVRFSVKKLLRPTLSCVSVCAFRFWTQRHGFHSCGASDAT